MEALWRSQFSRPFGGVSLVESVGANDLLWKQCYFYGCYDSGRAYGGEFLFAVARLFSVTLLRIEVYSIELIKSRRNSLGSCLLEYARSTQPV